MNTNEFKRDTEYYLHGLKDRGTVQVCYHKGKTTPAIIRELAITECRRYGKSAVFTKNAYDVCPLTTPVAAVFECVKSDKLTGGSTGNVGS